MKLNWFDKLWLDSRHFNWIRTDHKSEDWTDWKWISNFVKWNWDEHSDESFLIHKRVSYVCLLDAIAFLTFSIASHQSIQTFKCAFAIEDAILLMSYFVSIELEDRTSKHYDPFDHLIIRSIGSTYLKVKNFCLWISWKEMMRKMKWQNNCKSIENVVKFSLLKSLEIHSFGE